MSANTATATENTRIETDSIGEVAVPMDRYWGAQTQRLKQHSLLKAGIRRK